MAFFSLSFRMILRQFRGALKRFTIQPTYLIVCVCAVVFFCFAFIESLFAVSKILDMAFELLGRESEL